MTKHKRIKLPFCYPIILGFSNAHWERNATHHGKQSNPKLFAAKSVKLNRLHESQFIGKRIWFYFRGGYALYIEAFVDKRASL